MAAAGKNAMRKILVGGGKGFVGGRLCGLLKDKGFTPIILTRNSQHLGLHPSQFQQMTWTHLEYAGLPTNTEGVVNLAGANIGIPFRSFNDDYKESVYKSRVGTTGLLQKVISEAEKPPKVFVSSSAIGYYLPSETEEYDEDSLPGSDYFSRLCVDWEAAARLPENSPVRHVTIRIGLVLGRTGGIVENSFWPFFLGLGGPLGSGRQWFPWVHVDDVCGLILHALESPKTSGVLNAVAPQCITNREFASAFGAALRRPAFLPMPEFALKLMFGEKRAKMMLTGAKVLPRRTLESGYQFGYPRIQEAAMEFARFSKTKEEEGRLQSNQPHIRDRGGFRKMTNIDIRSGKPGSW